ncbi:hypothetical protein OKW30_001509 [Paraburkholderia sp. Clong3]|uniref:hypothetical protein n=1 Tax=unclassified Paraburkholderia TaxID=2615204 RepID=UPI00161FF6C8|nr:MULTISPECIES: hypothetical protein [unclassified Paraburkholderia]MBB5466018.1 hypothetical protein [Paraburkholderia sp. CI2]MBC8739861.1 hypothetical protein [Paraburkholderia sp. UCT31]
MKTILGGSSDENVNANRHTQVVGFSEQNSSEQIEKRGQLATMKASFSLEAVSDATCQHGESPAWDLSPEWARQKGTGSKLDWSKRYGRCAARTAGKDGQSSEAQAGL